MFTHVRLLGFRYGNELETKTQNNCDVLAIIPLVYITTGLALTSAVRR